MSSGGGEEDEAVADVGDVLGYIGEGLDQAAVGDFSFGQAGAFQGYALAVDCHCHGEEAAVEAGASGRGGVDVVAGEPVGPADQFVVGFDEGEGEEVCGGFDLGGEGGAAEGGYAFFAEWDDGEAGLAGEAVDDVGVELVGVEAGEVDAGGELDLEAGVGGEEGGEARGEPLGGEAEGGVEAEELGAGGGDGAQAAGEFGEAAVDVAPEGFAGWGEGDAGAVAGEELGADLGFEAADGVADGGWGEVEFFGCLAEGAAAGCGFEGAEGWEGEVHVAGLVLWGWDSHPCGSGQV